MQHTQPVHNPDSSKIFVGGLSWKTTEESLRYHFEQFGEVASVEVMRDRITGDPRGFAFVVFATDATVDLVMEEKKHEVDHKVVDVKRAQARGIAPPSIHGEEKVEGATTAAEGGVGAARSVTTFGRSEKGAAGDASDVLNKIFVGGLPPMLDRDGLKHYFENVAKCGAVSDAIVMTDPVQRRSRGFGFVTFADTESVKRAVAQAPHSIMEKYVEIKLAMPRGESAGAQVPNAGGGSGAHHQRMPFQKRDPFHSYGHDSGPKSEFSGLAANYGRFGWRAGYGTLPWGKDGWGVIGWEDFLKIPERTG
eukprot:CAMPEP_0113322532 /NCGR_PEP_ID=MMETSP0010_2-20120614/15672_1 /TAXON_ID=216773 ORGANISM="Corethron hystrix, Strain 308" /NCGR_SAMPLE_ID=MMETSP0010_2 /ASSEMBLY_ACC=CAM_ASM_000155 /LENGTH=306 /DNA_ID=CAMNT_0000181071 /DNA_START=70 /DNA_END=987 /DNA_ORIENTATION=+ /assembly_acc=CAM_ASM_000155